MTRFLVFASAALALAGSAAASIPAADGTITACYHRAFGALRVVDAPARRCHPHERTLTWSQSGGAGPGLGQLRADLEATRAELAATRAELAALQAAVGQLRTAVAASATTALGGALTLGVSGGRPAVRVNADLELADGGRITAPVDLLLLAGRDVRVEAGSDLLTVVGRNATTQVGGDSVVEVGGDALTTVAASASTTVGAALTTSVGLDASTSVGRNVSEVVGGNLTESVAGSSTRAAGGTASLDATQVNVGAAGTVRLQAATVAVPGLLQAARANIGGVLLP